MNKFTSIILNKCPHCQQGQYFKGNNPYEFKLFDKMNAKCSVCGQDFEMETGFYYGAMYVSYSLTVAYGIGLFLFCRYILHIDEIKFLFIFLGSLVLLWPVFYRLSRLTWINFFVKSKA